MALYISLESWDQGQHDGKSITSLFDNSIEGIRLKNKPVFSVQYHPEANPGPQDSKYLFSHFMEDVKKYAKKKRY